MSDVAARQARGLLDTSVLIDLGDLGVEVLPIKSSISAISLAELAAGPHVSTDPAVRALRQRMLQVIESKFDPLPFDADVARAYGLVAGAVVARGRKARGARSLDLMIAATALAHRSPLYTRNPNDFVGLEDLIEVRAI